MSVGVPDIYAILKRYWGYENFRPLQQDIIEASLAQKDALCLLPTGGGKSLCFQVPALAQDGLCLVISPLIALMKDQVENLKSKGILALAIYAGMSRRQIVQTLKNAAGGHFKFLYVSPERLETALFEEYLPSLHINLIAVDEAHCISQWGYDFRPSYLRIAALREQLPDVPVLALTASATEEVQKDICEKLLFTQPLIFRQSFERKNLSYSVFKADAKINKLVQILTKVKGTAIVYCKSRKRTVEIASLLQLQGISAQSYHAGLSTSEREIRQQDWIQNKVKVMVCTNAFGMGIDKPDVRTVVHIDIPDCLENYYQEAGRAGRDGLKSYAVLLYTDKDKTELSELHTKRFPSFDVIKLTYNALVNYLQIPLYSGQDASYTFKLEEFIKHFKLDSYTTLYALKALESDGWIYFNEKNFTPSTVVFTTTKQHLYDFYATHPQYEELLVLLLRTYEGIFDYPAFISEPFLSKLLKKEEAGIIKKQLKEASALSIIKYVPQNDEPQIIFRKARVAAADLTMDTALYTKRKESFTQRAHYMIEYVETAACRSVFINTYFGDQSALPCGICDTCLQARHINFTAEEFQNINAAINQSLSATSLTSTELLKRLNTPKEKAWKVIYFLQAENKIKVDKDGKVSLF